MSLAELETKMERAGETVGECLEQIRDGQLYKENGYDSFSAYCESRWNWKRAHVYRLIDYSKAVKQLKAENLPIPSEGALRPVLQTKKGKFGNNYKNEEQFIDVVVNTVAQAHSVSPNGDISASDIRLVMEETGTGRPKQTGPAGGHVNQDLSNRLTALLNTTAISQYTGEQYVKKFKPDAKLIQKVGEAIDRFMEILEVG